MTLKTFILFFAVADIILSFFTIEHHMLLRPLIHGNIFHCLANMWVLLTIVYIMYARWVEFITAIVIGYLILLYPWPYDIVGMSGIVYALFGVMSYRIPNKKLYHKWMLGFIAITIIIPNFAGLYHLACYASGVLACLPFYPVPKWLKI